MAGQGASEPERERKRRKFSERSKKKRGRQVKEKKKKERAPVARMLDGIVKLQMVRPDRGESLT